MYMTDMCMKRFPVAQIVELGTNNVNVMGLNRRECMNPLQNTENIIKK